ncbi:hypothetical protein SVAN01_10855 [Stagonosporopsis vannaccii]|nr:hypothetical protein SVAN01_10855 [Stagonosporopsis vannaccii]
MKLSFITALTTGLAASTGVSALPAGSSENTSPSQLHARGLWFRDECHATIGGTVVGGSTLWMLRNTWNNKFGGDFGGNLGVNGIKGVCCWGQCLWVASEGQGRSWSGDAWGNALHRLTGITGGSQRGLCGARINNDAYLVLSSAQHDQVSHQGRIMSDHFGDTCGGRPPW